MLLQTPSTSDRVGLRAPHLSHERVGSYPQPRHDPLDPITARSLRPLSGVVYPFPTILAFPAAVCRPLVALALLTAVRPPLVVWLPSIAVHPLIASVGVPTPIDNGASEFV